MRVSDVVQEKGSFIRWVSELARLHPRGLATIARKEGLGEEDALHAVQEAFQTFLLPPQARSTARRSMSGSSAA